MIKEPDDLKFDLAQKFGEIDRYASANLLNKSSENLTKGVGLINIASWRSDLENKKNIILKMRWPWVN